MSHRGSPMHFEFVKAVNYIDVAFYKNLKIRERWQAVLAHLSSDAYKPENWTPAAFDRVRDLLAELPAEMAAELGYKFDHLHIKEKAWTPTLHGRELEENFQLRRGLIDVVEGRRFVNVAVRPAPSLYPQPAPAPAASTAPSQAPATPAPVTHASNPAQKQE
jgi:hypothetical protein